SLERLAPRPSLMKSSNRDRHKWRVCVGRENRRAFLKRFGFAINAALSFRIQNERSPVPQAKGASPHGWDEIRIRIDYHHPQPAGQHTHKAGAEDFARSHREGIAEDFPGQQATQDRRVKETLVV